MFNVLCDFVIWATLIHLALSYKISHTINPGYALGHLINGEKKYDLHAQLCTFFLLLSQ